MNDYLTLFLVWLALQLFLLLGTIIVNFLAIIFFGYNSKRANGVHGEMSVAYKFGSYLASIGCVLVAFGLWAGM